MNERARIRDEKLSRLLRATGPETIRAMEADPGLPVRLRAMQRDGGESRAREGSRPPWAWLSLGTVGTVALTLSILLGGLIGYRAGMSAVTTSATSESAADELALWNAWSQSGFEEDLRRLNAGNGEVRE